MPAREGGNVDAVCLHSDTSRANEGPIEAKTFQFRTSVLALLLSSIHKAGLWGGDSGSYGKEYWLRLCGERKEGVEKKGHEM